MTRRKHADLIIAWANGSQIQVFDTFSKTWEDCGFNPAWNETSNYRIKPKEEYYFFPIFSHKEGMEFVSKTGSYFLSDVDTHSESILITFTGKVAKTSYLDGKITSIEIIGKDVE